MSGTHSNLDIFWILFCTVLILLMQAGFCCLESGLVRTKNSVNVAIKNFADFCVSGLIFWILGYSLMFGMGGLSFWKPELFFEFSGDPWGKVFFVFQLMFCGTAVTITSGSISERFRFSSYLIIVAMMSGIIYPIFGNWVWAGAEIGEVKGWLAQMGFLDFAGSTVVHSVGGWVALAAILIVGPRTGRFGDEKTEIKKHSIPLATLGVFLLWMGWFGFNAGSSYGFSDSIPGIFINTALSGFSGGMTALFLSWIIFRRSEVENILNGVLAGLVAITASCNLISPLSSVLIGGIAGGICLLGMLILEKFKIDDVVNAVPVHVGAGGWGTLALALFGDVNKWGTGLGRWDQLLVQMTGVGVCFIWSFGIGFCFLWIINKKFPLRVSKKEERIGLNISEHSLEGLTARVKKDEAMISATVDNLKDGIVTVDEEGNVEAFNPAASRMFEFSLEEIIGENVSTLIHSTYQNDTNNTDFKELLFDLSLDKDLKGFSFVGKRKNSDQFPVEITVSRMILEGHLFFVCIFRDVTERKKFEDRLIVAKSEAERANHAKTIFLSHMSHEIRTPMNAILGYAQILLRKKNLNSSQEKAIETISSNGQSLLEMINEILDISKIEAGRMELNVQDFDLKNLISNISNMFELRCREKALNWKTPEIEIWHLVSGDEKKLKQVLINLIGNAIRFTDVGEVFLNVISLENDRYRFEVSDTGRGISEEARENIFKAFYQDDTDRGGTGLGLAIAKKQIDLMGSTLELESEKEKGSRFYFTLSLPRSSEVCINEPSENLEIDSLKKGFSVNALVVDDVKENLEVLSGLLTDIGVVVETAENGKGALQKIDKNSPDIIFMDLRMPVMNGEEAVSKINNKYGKDRFPIVIISASVFGEKEKIMDKLDCQAFISKPFNCKQVFRCLQEILHVEFEYRNKTSENEKTKHLMVDFSKMSLEKSIHEKIIEAAELNNITVLEMLFREVIVSDVELKGLSEILMTHMANYDMDAIISTLNKIKSV